METFFEQLISELQRSLGETFRLFESRDQNLSSVVADLATKVIVSVLLIGIFVLGFLILRRILNAILNRFKVNKEIGRPLNIALRYIVIVMAILALMVQYGVPSGFTSSVARASVVLFGFFAGWLFARRFLVSYFEKQNIDPSLLQLFVNISQVLIIVFALTTVLSQFGINVFSVITALGVVGIAVGFAAQDTLSNFISGITLLIERPFRINDWVRVGDDSGKIEEINLRTTRMRTRDNEMVVIPNSTIASSEITNLSAGGPLRIRIPLGIAYKEDIPAARDVLMPIMTEHKGLLQTPKPLVWVTDLGDSSVNLEMVYWIDAKEIDASPRTSRAILEDAKIALDKAEIEIPFPHLQLFVDEAKGLEPFLEAKPSN